MDPLSATAGVVGLVSMAGSVLGKCYTYGCAAAGATKEMRRLFDEITSLSGVLVAISGLMHAHAFGESKEISILDTLSRCEGILKEIDTALIDAGPDPKKNYKLAKIISKLRWPFRQKETMELVERLERQKATLNVAVTANSAAAIADIRDGVSDIQRSLDDAQLNETAERIFKEQRQIFKTLSQIDHKAMHAKVSGLHLAGTGQWLLDSHQVLDLVQAKQRFLWLYGIPGSGKSVMTSCVLNQRILPRRSQKEFVAYFYCDFRETDSQKPEVVLGSLVSQLCKQLGSIPTVLRETMKKHLGDDGSYTNLSFDELAKCLVDVLRACPSTTIVVDGLDECNDRQRLIELLAQLSNMLDPSTVKVLATSRREVDIERQFRHQPQLSVQSQSADEDINRCIISELNSNPRFGALGDELKKHIAESLAKTAHGMFRLVRCQLDELAKLRTVRATRQALSSLPRDLDGTYERILCKIQGQDVELARRALTWLAYARRPLLLEELAEAAILEDDDNDDDDDENHSGHLDSESRLRDPSEILEILGCLVSVLPVSSRVVLAHNSVREFLVSRKSHDWHIPNADALLARRCLSYVLLDEFARGPCRSTQQMEQRMRSYPLLRYASARWPDHAKDHLSSDTRLLNEAMRLMNPDRTPNFLCWIQMLLVGPAQRAENYSKYPPNAAPLYYASSYALMPIVDRLLQNPEVDVDEKGGRFGATALHAACFRNHPAIVKRLLDAGAAVRAPDHRGHSALDLTTSTGNRKILSLLKELDNDPLYSVNLGKKPPPPFSFHQHSIERDDRQGHFRVVNR